MEGDPAVVGGHAPGLRGRAPIHDAGTAASKVATTVFRVWGGTYFTWDPGEHYATDVGVRPLRFDCAKFLGLLNGGDEDSTVDCSDVAAIASTFAGILGCQLSQLAIDMTAHQFRAAGRAPQLGVAEIRAARIRRQRCRGPVLGPRPRVWDACIEVSGDRPFVGRRRALKALLPAGLLPANYLLRLLRLRGGL